MNGWMKWIGTLAVILAAGCRGFGLHGLDLGLSALGAAIWMVVAVRMRDGALITVNSFILLMMGYGLVRIV
jgi:hypothetical protein